MAAESSSYQPFGQCRCCLKFGYHKDIAEPYYKNGVRKVYREIIWETFKLLLSANTEVTNRICLSCICRLNDATEFKAMVVESECQLLGKTTVEQYDDAHDQVKQEIIEGDEGSLDPIIIPNTQFDDGWSKVKNEQDTQIDIQEDCHSTTSETVFVISELPTATTENTMELASETHQIVDAFGGHNDTTAKPECNGTFIDCKTHKIKQKHITTASKEANTGANYVIKCKINNAITYPSKEVSDNGTDGPGAYDCVGSNDSAAGYSCTQCEHVTRTERLLQCHLKAHSAKTQFICDTCGHIATRKKRLIRHVRTHAAEKRHFTCTVCSKTFDCSSKLNIHIKTHTGNKPYACNICDKRFKRKAHLKDHAKVHSGERPFACEICKKTFIHNSSLKTHMKRHSERPFACEICKKTFIHNFSLKAHMKWHSERPFACEICKKTFIHNSQLKVHMKMHSDERPFACEICKKTFIHNSQLRVHMKRQHTDKKPFGLEIYSQKYSQNRALYIHMKMHRHIDQVPKQYVCEICDIQYSSSKSLTSHMRTHTGEKPYACKFCDKRFTHSSGLCRHIRSMHTNLDPV